METLRGGLSDRERLRRDDSPNVGDRGLTQRPTSGDFDAVELPPRVSAGGLAGAGGSRRGSPAGGEGNADTKKPGRLNQGQPTGQEGTSDLVVYADSVSSADADPVSSEDAEAEASSLDAVSLDAVSSFST